MVEGFKLRVPAGELKSHCASRADYHRTRADEKEKELPALRDAMGKLKVRNQAPDRLSHMNKASASYNLDPDDPVESLETDIRNHRNKALVFDFFAGHLFDEDYTLSESDLQRLEITRG